MTLEHFQEMGHKFGPKLCQSTPKGESWGYIIYITLSMYQMNQDLREWNLGVCSLEDLQVVSLSIQCAPLTGPNGCSEEVEKYPVLEKIISHEFPHILNGQEQ